MTPAFTLQDLLDGGVALFTGTPELLLILGALAVASVHKRIIRGFKAIL